MRFPALLLLFYLCISCQQAETAPMRESIVSVKEKDTLTSLEKELTGIQKKIQEDLAEVLYKKTLPTLPGNNEYFGKLQINALETGSQKSLQRVYQQIETPPAENSGKVRHLDLSYQNIHYIPNKVTQFPDLRYLSLKSNQIQAINPKLGLCKELKKLDLSSNGIQNIPFEIIHLTQIENLVFADNNLTTLPAFFFNLNYLKSLDISNVHTAMAEYYNDIQRFPKVLLRMPGLEKLFLEKLPLRNLPKDLYRMKSLQVLSLNGNREMNLSQTFEVLSTMRNLVALDLSFIGRRTLPKNISKLKNLKVLIWHEENKLNADYIENTLKVLLPDTRIYYGKKGIASPFLRGNSINTLKKAGY